MIMPILRRLAGAITVVVPIVALSAYTGQAQAQAPEHKPNIILIVSDDFGYGDAAPYGGGLRGSQRVPRRGSKLRDMFNQVTKGAMSGNAGETAHEEFKVNGEYVNTPDKGIVGIPFLDGYVEKAATDYLDKVAKSDK